MLLLPLQLILAFLIEVIEVRWFACMENPVRQQLPKIIEWHTFVNEIV